ncbi:unnamed protein product [Pleuronectes platessa]|uniref:Uncharacterized protein n=1 Tax=Pleuronectes platessa TaxID=8262 RepID=A0A9N7VEU5_PLEPL|nr:unnamed protein product [Pleuronectes platessa]
MENYQGSTSSWPPLISQSPGTNYCGIIGIPQRPDELQALWAQRVSDQQAKAWSTRLGEPEADTQWHSHKPDILSADRSLEEGWCNGVGVSWCQLRVKLCGNQIKPKLEAVQCVTFDSPAHLRVNQLANQLALVARASGAESDPLQPLGADRSPGSHGTQPRYLVGRPDEAVTCGITNRAGPEQFKFHRKRRQSRSQSNRFGHRR